MEQRVKQLEQEVEQLKSFIKSLTTDTTIPFDVEKSFSRRLRVARADTTNTPLSDVTVTIDAMTGGDAAKVPDDVGKIYINNIPWGIGLYEL